jgi:hypothetical protein
MIVTTDDPVPDVLVREIATSDRFVAGVSVTLWGWSSGGAGLATRGKCSVQIGTPEPNTFADLTRRQDRPLRSVPLIRADA